MKTVMKLIVVLAGGVFIGTILSLGYLMGQRSGGPHTEPAASGAPVVTIDGLQDLTIPEFSLTDQDGRTVTRESLLGRVTILDFMFTHCPFACPRLTAQMLSMSNQLKDTPVRFISISVDPERDTPAVLKAHAEKYGADLLRWTFLTGEIETVKKVAVEGLKFALVPDEKTVIPLPDGTEMHNILHPTHFVLIGPDLKILGIYRSSEEAKLPMLVEQARVAALATRPG